MGARIAIVKVCLARNHALGRWVREVTSALLSVFTLPGRGDLDAGGHAQWLLNAFSTQYPELRRNGPTVRAGPGKTCFVIF